MYTRKIVFIVYDMLRCMHTSWCRVYCIENFTIFVWSEIDMCTCLPELHSVNMCISSRIHSEYNSPLFLFYCPHRCQRTSFTSIPVVSEFARASNRSAMKCSQDLTTIHSTSQLISPTTLNVRRCSHAAVSSVILRGRLDCCKTLVHPSKRSILCCPCKGLTQVRVGVHSNSNRWNEKHGTWTVTPLTPYQLHRPHAQYVHHTIGMQS